MGTRIDKTNFRQINDIYLRDILLIEVNVITYDGKSIILSFGTINNDMINCKLKIKMYHVIKADLYIDEDDYWIEDFKFIFDESNDYFYLSLDPDQSTVGISENDCGVFIAKSVEYFQESKME